MTRQSRARILFVGLLVSVCFRGGASERLNIILVSEDQLAAGHVHAYGYPRPTTPNLDAMASRGVLFSRFYASGSWTTPSYCSMMTGLYPSKHGMTLFMPDGAPGTDPAIPLLAERFAGAGYKTVAFSNNGNAGGFLIGRGFKEFFQGQEIPDNITERDPSGPMDFRAPGTNERIFSWLEANKSESFFMFVLYFEPHSPYDPPPAHDIFKTTAYPEEKHTGYDPVDGRLLRWAAAGDDAARRRLVDLYDGKIHFVDEAFGRLLARLSELGLDRNTVVLLLSDHGELLYTRPDYWTFDHRSLYDENIRVPLVIRGPGIPAGKTIDSLASHIDVLPTILDLAGLPPLDGIAGRSLVPAIKGTSDVVHEYVFAEQDVIEPLRSVRDKRYKMILNARSGERRLFDLEKDPGERANVISLRPEAAGRLGKALDLWMAENQPDEAAKLARWKDIVRWRAPGFDAFGPDGTERGRIVDEVAIGSLLQLNGSGWRMGDGLGNYLDACYWTEPGRGKRSAVWRTDNPLMGRYNIYLRYGGVPGRTAARNARFTVRTKTGSREFRVDQSAGAGEWNLLGTFIDPLDVSVTDEADGPVVVDAVKFLRIAD
jgi:arylsulfatase A-like enzyme